jgi:DNA polymerase-3 subunit delta
VSELDEVVRDIKKGQLAPLYLLWGEEFLVRKGADELVKVLLPDASPGLNFSVQDGASPREVAQELATLPMFPGRKVVLARDPEFLAPKKGRADALAKAKDAFRAGRRREAAKRVLAFVARAGWGLDALDPESSSAPPAEAWKEELNVELSDADWVFLQELHQFCEDEGITAPEGDDSALLDLYAKGLPPGHILVIAATEVEARSPWVKLAKDQGVLIERKVEARLKDLDLGQIAREILGPFAKRLSPSAEKLLKERVGGNMRLLQSELEKLALHAQGQVIEAADVALLVAHARDEEFLELSDALQKRDLAAALRYLDEALGQRAQPLQLLGAMASITRGLLENRERLSELPQGRAPRGYDEFKDRVLPRIEEELRAQKRKVPHPYGLFLGLQAAARYGPHELRAALRACGEADLQLKSSADGRLVLERLLWTVCGAAPAA